MGIALNEYDIGQMWWVTCQYISSCWAPAPESHTGNECYPGNEPKPEILMANETRHMQLYI